MMLPAGSVVPKSGQNWKLGVALAGSITGLALLWWCIWGGGPEDYAPLGLLLAVLFLVFPCIAIRCRKCGSPWLWTAVSAKGHDGWLNWLAQQSNCPACGFDPRTGASR